MAWPLPKARWPVLPIPPDHRAHHGSRKKQGDEAEIMDPICAATTVGAVTFTTWRCQNVTGDQAWADDSWPSVWKACAGSTSTSATSLFSPITSKEGNLGHARVGHRDSI